MDKSFASKVHEWNNQHFRKSPVFPTIPAPQTVADPSDRILKRLTTYDKPVDPPVMSLKESPLTEVEESMCCSEVGLKESIAEAIVEINNYVRYEKYDKKKLFVNYTVIYFLAHFNTILWS